MSRFRIKAKLDPVMKPIDDFFEGHVFKGHNIDIVADGEGTGVMYQCRTCNPEAAERLQEIVPCSCSECADKQTVH